MPEGPEVHTIADQIGQQIVGKHLVSIQWDQRSKYRNGVNCYDDLSLHMPIRIESVNCKGKQIFFELKNMYSVDGVEYTRYFYINCTLGMEGKLIWTRGDHSNLWFEIGDMIKGKNVRIGVLEEILYFDDSRHFGNIIILTETSFNDKLNSIGPDLLSDDISEGEWLNKSRSPRLHKKQICDFLMEQKYFSGVGNYLKAEILYDAKIKPDRIMGDLSDDELIAIFRSARQKIKESYQSNGLTIRSYLSPDGRMGQFERVVYDKETDPYGNKVIKTVFGDKRTTHWVPSIQI